MSEYRITFGMKYPQEPHPTFPRAHHDGYVTVVADGREDARRQAVEVLSTGWAFDYPAEELEDRFAPLGELGRIENGRGDWQQHSRSPATQTAAVEARASGRETGEGARRALSGLPLELPIDRTVRLALDLAEAKTRLIHARAVLKHPHHSSCTLWVSLEADCTCWQADLRTALDGELY